MKFRISKNKVKLFAAILLLNSGILRADPPDENRILELITGWQMDRAAELMEKTEVSAELKGIYSFFAGDYEEALEYLEGSGTPWEELVRGTLRAAEGFEEKHTSSFIIRYRGRDKAVAVQLAPVMERAVKRLDEVFGWAPEEKVVLEIYPDRETFQMASTLTDEHIRVSGAVGICKFNRIMILSPGALMFGYGWPDTAVHEYVHYIVGRLAKPRNVPLWFNEGLAKRFETYWKEYESSLTPAEKNHLIRASESDSWVEFEKMRYGMPTLDSRQEVVLAFAQVHSIVRYLERERGRENLALVLRLLRENDPDTAFREGFRRDIDGLFGAWKEYLKAKELEFTPGASAPSFAFADDPGGAVAEWVAETASADIRIAGMFENRGNYRAAARKYKDALEKNPGCSVTLNSLARAQIRTGETVKAAENFRKAISNNPSYPPPYIHLSRILLEEEEFSDAAGYIRRYIYRTPFNPEAYRILSKALELSGDAEGAKEAEELLEIISGR